MVVELDAERSLKGQEHHENGESLSAAASCAAPEESLLMINTKGLIRTPATVTASLARPAATPAAATIPTDKLTGDAMAKPVRVQADKADAARFLPRRRSLATQTVVSFLCEVGITRKLPPRAVVVAAGAPSESLYVVVHGTLEVRRADEAVEAVLHGGDLLGLSSFLMGTPPTHTVVVAAARGYPKEAAAPSGSAEVVGAEVVEVPFILATRLVARDVAIATTLFREMAMVVTEEIEERSAALRAAMLVGASQEARDDEPTHVHETARGARPASEVAARFGIDAPEQATTALQPPVPLRALPMGSPPCGVPVGCRGVPAPSLALSLPSSSTSLPILAHRSPRPRSSSPTLGRAAGLCSARGIARF